MQSSRFQQQCRHFSGYKPCGFSKECSAECPALDLVTTRILIIHLGALGAVARSTSLLLAIRRKYHQSHITWVTDRPAEQLLISNPLIDRVLTTEITDQLVLQSLEFDVALVIDKSLKANGVLAHTHADLIYGFSVDKKTGTIVPATEAATELWELGLSNQKKFYENKKPETQLIHEALELGPFRRDEYFLPLTEAEEKEAEFRRRTYIKDSTQPLIGINTGCSNVIIMKRLTVEYQRQLIQSLLISGYKNIVLLGGPEDTIRNQQISFDLPVANSPTTAGLRDGLISVEACDVVITGDSLGMHLAIARKKQVIAWFGPTCAHEIELYDRGESILAPVSCGPCWLRKCNKTQMCYDLIEVESFVAATTRAVVKLQAERCPPKEGNP